jgi:acetylornithine deacetylase/succinyl-diaminopimelate desuccinylase-like protein
MNAIEPGVVERIAAAVNRARLLETAVRLCSVYSPTGSAAEVSDQLAAMLAGEGFRVERPTGGYPAAPAVAARYDTDRPGRVLQFDGHLDTVHLPFVPPQVIGDRLTGSGSADMKAGVAAAIEALRVIRETGVLPAGGVLFTAHDLHESPWGDGSQLEGLINEGYIGNAVLIPEYLRDVLAVAGRGQATWRMRIVRPGPPIHEVMRPLDEPSVIAAGAEAIRRFEQWNGELATLRDPWAGTESVFVGQMHSGEIYNQYPQECRLEGTRRWLPGRDAREVETEFRGRVQQLAHETGTEIELDYLRVRDAFYLDENDALVAAFQASLAALGKLPLAHGGKPFVDDGNTFWAKSRVAAITHGPLAGGAHTLEEWVSIDDLARVARLYALTAAAYCGQDMANGSKPPDGTP